MDGQSYNSKIAEFQQHINEDLAFHELQIMTDPFEEAVLDRWVGEFYRLHDTFDAELLLKLLPHPLRHSCQPFGREHHGVHDLLHALAVHGVAGDVIGVLFRRLFPAQSVEEAGIHLAVVEFDNRLPVDGHAFETLLLFQRLLEATEQPASAVKAPLCEDSPQLSVMRVHGLALRRLVLVEVDLGGLQPCIDALDMLTEGDSFRGIVVLDQFSLVPVVLLGALQVDDFLAQTNAEMEVVETSVFESTGKSFASVDRRQPRGSEVSLVPQSLGDDPHLLVSQTVENVWQDLAVRRWTIPAPTAQVPIGPKN